MASNNGVRCYECIVYSQWPKAYSSIDRKKQVSASVCVRAVSLLQLVYMFYHNFCASIIYLWDACITWCYQHPSWMSRVCTINKAVVSFNQNHHIHTGSGLYAISQYCRSACLFHQTPSEYIYMYNYARYDYLLGGCDKKGIILLYVTDVIEWWINLYIITPWLQFYTYIPQFDVFVPKPVGR